MRELSLHEVEEINGGLAPLAVLAAAVLIYNAANIIYEFGKGVAQGYEANDKV